MVNEPCENMRMYHEAMSKNAQWQVAMAEATKGKTKMNMMLKYLDLMEKDTSDFNDERLE